MTLQVTRGGRFSSHALCFWDKVYLIREALSRGYAYVIWLDADTLIVRPDIDLREAVPQQSIGATWHSMVWGADWCYDHFSAGVLYLCNCPKVRLFVDEWWDTPDDGHPWGDQHAFAKLIQ